jgi:glycosyltransferase involved in cell wall biosynthesis
MTSLLAVAPVDHPGGAEVGLMRLLGRLRDAGWAITLTTPGRGPLRDQAAARGLRCERLPLGGLARGTGGRAVASWPAARRLARAHDVVYLNGTVCGRLLPALPRDRRTVLHVHDMVARVPRFWRRADVVLADSAAVAERLGPLAARAHVVGCPVEPIPPAVTPPWAAGDRPVVGYVGRIEPRKGVLDLVAAAPRLVAAGARVVIVGDDPYGSAPGYLAAVDASTAIERFAWVDGAAGLMGALDVLVLPSHAEPFGTVLAEAMNAGTPVVATRVGGIPEVVEDGVTGRLVAPGDPGALAEAVLEVLARRDEMGAAARRRATRWHADAYARRVEELITP